MADLQVKLWRKYGHDRAYVSLADSGKNVAWMDRKTGQITYLMDGYRDSVLAALAPYMTTKAPLSSASAPPPEEFDLERNRPGDAVRAQAARVRPGWFERMLARLLRRKTASSSWEAGAAGELVVGARLDSLVPRGWRVLHSIPLPNNTDIDHLAIGPGGVFTVNAKHFAGARVWVGDAVVKVNNGPARPMVVNSRREAQRVARVLGAAGQRDLPVHPVLAFVAVSDLRVEPTLRDVAAVKAEVIDAALLGYPRVLSPDAIEAVYQVARDARVWGNR